MPGHGNRSLKAIYGKALRPHEMRALLLGGNILEWCDKVEPVLRDELQAAIGHSSKLMGEVGADIDKLILMPEDAVSWPHEQFEDQSSPEAQKEREFWNMKAKLARINRMSSLIGMMNELTGIQERQARTYMAYSAGGQASVWNAAQRAAAKASTPADTAERPVKPFRKFGDVHKLQQQSQPVEAEVVEAEGAE